MTKFLPFTSSWLPYPPTPPPDSRTPTNKHPQDMGLRIKSKDLSDIFEKGGIMDEVTRYDAPLIYSETGQ